MIAPEVEDTIEAHLEHPAYGVPAKCPTRVPIVVGHTFDCTIRLATRTATVLVKIESAGGDHYHVEVVS